MNFFSFQMIVFKANLFRQIFFVSVELFSLNVFPFFNPLEMAEEMGISMDRFDVVRRAMALAAHCNDNTPALSGMNGSGWRHRWGLELGLKGLVMGTGDGIGTEGSSDGYRGRDWD